MFKRIIKRTGQAVLTIFVVVTLTFGLIRLLPGGPLDYLRAQLQQQSTGGVDTARLNQLVESYTNVRPDEPLLVQYVDYMSSVLTGDFGQSIWYTNQEVSAIIAGALPWTLLIMSISILLMFTLGILLGAVMAYREGSRFDLSVSGFSIVLNSIPFYVAGLVLLYLFAYQLQLFPTRGQVTSGTTAGFNWSFIAGVLHHAALPILSLVITEFGGWALAMRGNSIQILGEEYLRVARLRGLSERRIAVRYVGRNAILPMYTNLLIAIGFMFGGSVILERIFVYPGIGYYLFQSINARDYPLMMGTFIVITVTVVVGVLVADLTYGLIDPRTEGSNESF
jgi:peptide/nickel transport system permease protein